MAFGLFKRKDPVCGMKEEKGKGLVDGDIWFCSKHCLNEYKKRLKKSKHQYKGCCSK
ncbi:hypothetical protein GOV08_05240 [Candidatus Woesearchaeota archaeon]|nr:hypothetical protein [Candidatus Woesearchaeota archaeon]